MWWPGKIPAASECSELASTIDILPTIAHLGGMELPKRKIDGRNIWPLMSGKAGAKTPHEAFYYYSGSKLSGVRSGKWKLLFAQGFVQQKPPGKDGQPGTRATGRIPLSLFNLEKDVGEKLNVAAANPEVVRKLQGLAGEMRKKLGDAGRAGTEIRPVGR
jgi:arylsulfatase A